MRVDRNLIGWGLFFIVFGAVLLGVRQGWIPADLAARAWQIWPLFLIAGGLSLVLAGRPGAWIGGLVAAACFGVIAGGLVASGSGLPFVGCGADDSGTPFAAQSGEVAAGSQVNIEFRCGDLLVAGGEGTGWTVSGRSDEGAPPEIDQDGDGLELKAGSGSGIFGFAGSRELWDVTLPTGRAFDLDLTLNAGAGIVNLAAVQVEHTDFTVNAGSLELDLRNSAAGETIDGTVNAGSAIIWLPERQFSGSLTVNAGSLSLCALEGVGIRLDTGSSPLSSNDFEQGGLIRNGDVWESPDFSTAPFRIALDVQANAGSLSLNPRETCAG
jgi:hypothetical protein